MEKNPFAELADNESLYIDDPKKMIEKWFDREGYDFDKSLYQVGPIRAIKVSTEQIHLTGNRARLRPLPLPA